MIIPFFRRNKKQDRSVSERIQEEAVRTNADPAADGAADHIMDVPGGGHVFHTDERGVLTSYEGPGGEVKVPEGVTCIGTEAFAFCSQVTGAVLPEGVRTISKRAFCRSGIRTISLPESLYCIEKYAFFDTPLEEVRIPDQAANVRDRAFAGALAPGSTFKPLTACAALEEKKITAHTSIECNGVYTKDGMELWCMGYHGEQELDSAMADSCNVFFAETGRLAGIDALEKYAKRCGLGVKTGVEIYESTGTLAGPEFSRLTGSEWYPGQTAAAAIGQSDSQFTPLQLAAYCGTIANGGKRLKTHVVDHIEKYKSGVTTYRSEPETADDMGVSEKNLQEVREAMYAAAKSYSQLQEYPIEIAGKTGTAENGGSDHANFICFAPYDKPEIAVAVMVEHGAKSGIAVNAAKKILDEYFHTENSEG